MPTSTLSETVNLVEAGEILKVHPKTVETYIHAELLPAAKPGKCWMMMRRDVVALAERIIIEHTAARLAQTDSQGKGAINRTSKKLLPNLSRENLRRS